MVLNYGTDLPVDSSVCPRAAADLPGGLDSEFAVSGRSTTGFARGGFKLPRTGVFEAIERGILKLPQDNEVADRPNRPNADRTIIAADSRRIHRSPLAHRLNCKLGWRGSAAKSRYDSRACRRTFSGSRRYSFQKLGCVNERTPTGPRGRVGASGRLGARRVPRQPRVIRPL